MRQLERHQQILNHLTHNETLTLEDAIEMFQASPATLRRDFNRLAEQGRAERVRGGLRQLRPIDGDMVPFVLREVRQAREKAGIAAYAAGLLQPGNVVIVDGGTTTFFLSRHLPEIPLRVITNSLRLAATLEERRRHHSPLEIYLTGGYLYPHSGLLVGPSSLTSLSQYHAHWAFLSVGGITTGGVSNTNELVVETERVMIANADRVAVLADHTKIGIHAMCHVCALEEIDVLITNAHPESHDALDRFREAGVDVRVV